MNNSKFIALFDNFMGQKNRSYGAQNPLAYYNYHPSEDTFLRMTLGSLKNHFFRIKPRITV